jgi:hypothetical protein
MCGLEALPLTLAISPVVGVGLLFHGMWRLGFTYIILSPILVPVGLVTSPFVLYHWYQENKRVRRYSAELQRLNIERTQKLQEQQEIIDEQERERLNAAKKRCQIQN